MQSFCLNPELKIPNESFISSLQSLKISTILKRALKEHLIQLY